MAIIQQGFSKITEDEIFEQLDDNSEMNCSISSGLTLESVSKVIGDAVLTTMLDYIQPKIGSTRWIDRYTGMLAFGAILDGPNPDTICSYVGQAFEGILNMINDPIQRVRHTVSYVYYKLSEFEAGPILNDKNLRDLFVGNCLNHIDEHPIIGSLLAGSLKNLYVQAYLRNCSSLMNEYFSLVFEKIFSKLFDQSFHDMKELQSIIDSLNDIVEYCDTQNLMAELFNFLT
jgi:importin subunit beta-1